MANKVSKSKSAVRAAREAVKASQKEVLERAARNAEDLAVFFSSRERLDAVDEWLEAEDRRASRTGRGQACRASAAAGRRCVALRDRGETVRDIARLAGMTEKSAAGTDPASRGAPRCRRGRPGVRGATLTRRRRRCRFEPPGWGGAGDADPDAPVGRVGPRRVGDG